MRTNRLVVFALACALLLPALASGEVVRLRDGSSMRGRLLAVEGDSLTFRLAIGPRVKIHREQILAIAFDDSLGAAVLAGPGAVASPLAAPVPQGTGKITVAFKDRSVSSKISIKRKKNWDEHARSNHIVLELLLDARVVYSVVDSTTDKTIYKGEITQLKNNTVLEDFSVEVPAGVYQLEVIVRNLDEQTFREDFDPEPLHAAIVIDNFEVRTDRGARVELGIDKGALKMGKGKFYRVQ
jgi:hypothetical protein